MNVLHFNHLDQFFFDAQVIAVCSLYSDRNLSVCYSSVHALAFSICKRWPQIPTNFSVSSISIMDNGEHISSQYALFVIGLGVIVFFTVL